MAFLLLHNYTDFIILNSEKNKKNNVFYITYKDINRMFIIV